jgi:chromate transporter
VNEEQKQTVSLKTIFITFLKIGLFTFGGGYAMVPLIEYEMVEKYHWIDSKEIIDIIAVAAAAPGVIAVNTATFVGYRIAGLKGALTATLGMITPSYFIICTISLFYQQFKDLEWVTYGFSGIRAGVIVLLLGAVIEMAKKFDRTAIGVLILLITFVLATFTEVNVIFLLLGGGLTGMIFQVFFNRDVVSEHEKGENE